MYSIVSAKMTESNQETMTSKKHEVGKQIGYFPFKGNKSWTDNFYFVIGADSQFGYIWPYKERNSRDWKIEMDKAICAIDKINNLTPRPQFLVICGDLVNEMPQKNTELNELQIKDFQRVFSKLHPSISLVCVCGNHDVGDTPDEYSIKKYHNNFGPDYFSFWCGGVLFLVINTQYYKDKSKVEKLANEQDLWITEKLNKHKGQRIIVFQHIPWFLHNLDEDNGYFNIDKNLRKKMLEKLDEAGVSYIFCGHYHQNMTGFYKNTEIVTTCALGAPMGEDPSGLRVVKLYENNVTHTYHSLELMPSSIIIND